MDHLTRGLMKNTANCVSECDFKTYENTVVGGLSTELSMSGSGSVKFMSTFCDNFNFFNHFNM